MYSHVFNTFLLLVISSISILLICRLEISEYELRKMPRKANEISVEWLESKDAGRRNHVNIKHISCELSEIAVGKEVAVRLNACRYRATVVDLLDWTPPQPERTSRKKNKVEKVWLQ